MHKILFFAAIGLCSGCEDRRLDARTVTPVSSNEAFHNPVDDKTYVAPGGWKSYQPEVRRPEDPARKVKADNVRLLTAQDDIAARTTVEELAVFIREAERLANESFGASGKRFKVLAKFTCTPSKHEVELAHQGEATREILQTYYNALKGAKKLAVKDGEVSFQIEFSVSP